MINCLVCIKYVPDHSVESNVDINRESILSKINPADMFAIEESIRIKEKHGGRAVGLCMGVASAGNALKTAIAMGLDDVVLLSDKKFAGSDTLATSYVLSRGIQHLGTHDLILCGKQSTDGDTGQVGQEIASYLDWPCIINVVEISFDSDNAITCKILDENGYIYLKSKLPAVVCVLKGINEPRIPTITGILNAQQTSVRTICAEDFGVLPERCGLEGSPTRVKCAMPYKFPERTSIDITDEYVEKLENIIDSNNSNGITNVPDYDTSSSVSKKSGEVWVVAEIVEEKVVSVSLEIISKARQFATKHNRLLSVLVLDLLEERIVQQLSAHGVDIIYTTNQFFTRFNEAHPLTIVNACRSYGPEVLLFGSTTWGKWVSPNVAAKLQTGLTADCIDLQFSQDNTDLIQTRIAFGGSVLAQVFCPNARPQMATIRKGVFEKTSQSDYCPDPRIIDIGNLIDVRNRIETLPCQENITRRKVNLSTASIIVAGGKGVGKENFPLLCKFADLIGGEVGATRYAVDAGWVDYAHQIGQTGVTVKPRIFISFGISGASEHLVGMRDAECIISVNSDIRAPVLSISNYRIIGDCGDVIKSLIEHFERVVTNHDIH